LVLSKDRIPSQFDPYVEADLNIALNVIEIFGFEGDSALFSISLKISHYHRKSLGKLASSKGTMSLKRIDRR
jgi:hypothetical protein